MGDITGPILSLPGSGHATPDGMMCDDHPDRPAVARIQGETDSFGCEMNDLCAECVAAIRLHTVIGQCDWCKQESGLVPQRDFDEGMCGPVYYVCGDCSYSYAKRLLEATQ